MTVNYFFEIALEFYFGHFQYVWWTKLQAPVLRKWAPIEELLQLCSLIWVFFVHMKKRCFLGYTKCAQWRFWSDYANVQAELNLGWLRKSEGTFSDGAAHLFSEEELNHLLQHITHYIETTLQSEVEKSRKDQAVQYWAWITKALVLRNHNLAASFTNKVRVDS